MAERWEAAREAAGWYANVFDGRYYLEVQGHDSEGQALLNERIFQLAGELGLPVVATNDAHFLRADDHQAHDTLLCIGLGKDKDDPDRMHYDRGLYFKSGPEMAERFPAHPEVLENTLRIADEVDLRFEKTYYVPRFPTEAQGYRDEDEMLRAWVWRGAVERYGRDGGKREAEAAGKGAEAAVAEARSAVSAEIAERVEYELGVITSLGYSGYFLITADFIKWARDHDIPVGPGRGSAAGSILRLLLGIAAGTSLPIEFDLLFELPQPGARLDADIDVDFCFERRAR